MDVLLCLINKNLNFTSKIIGGIFSLMHLLTLLLPTTPPPPPTTPPPPPTTPPTLPPPTTQPKAESWPGRYCPRQRKEPALDGRRRYIKTDKCTGGENGLQCLSCQLKIAQNTCTFGKPFKYKMYIHRTKKYWMAMKNLKLVRNPLGVPMYDGASWIIQVLLCDYLDEFSCLSLVQPPVDYIRNPAYVQRDEKYLRVKQDRVRNRGTLIIESLKFVMKGICRQRFGTFGEDKYNLLQPDWLQYHAYCVNKWLDDEVPADEIRKEAQRLIDSALKQQPTLAIIPGVLEQQVVDDTTDSD